MIAAMKAKISAKDRRRIAAATGVNERYLYQCLTGRREMAPESAVLLEKASNAEISRLDVCHKTGKGIWPELAAAAPPPSQQPPHSAAAGASHG